MEPTQTGVQEIALNQITVGSRMRGNLGDIQGLADSISRIGLTQPIVLDRNHNLIAGERRFRAHELLKKETIRYIYSDETDPDVQAEIEFEENFWRKAFSWQEEALGILRIYRQKKLKGDLEGWKVSYQQILAEMFGMAIGRMNYVLIVAKRLEQELSLPEDKRKYWKYQSVSEAYRMGLLGEEVDSKNKYLAELQKARTNSPVQQAAVHAEIKEIERVSSSDDELLAAKFRYEQNPLNTVPFEQYWKEKQDYVAKTKNTIHISNRFHCGDCIDFMLDPAKAATFDHILTDPPYAIDIDFLNQNNIHAGIQDLDRLRDQHQRSDNMALLRRFWPAAWQITKDDAFVIVWCDMDVWDFMKNLAIDAGFAVQRWPVIWKKINQSVMNNCAGYNTTKDYEVAMIARKPGATLYEKRNSSIIEASNVQVTKETGHPFAKPYETTKALLDLISIKGQSILDPFMGGGSIVVQGLRSERNMFGCELSEAEAPWFNQAMTNIKNLYYLKINPDYVFQ